MIRQPFLSVLVALFGAALFIPTLASAQQDAPLSYRDEQPVRAQHGMVVSVHHLASDAGLEMLRADGNAVDAAVADCGGTLDERSIRSNRDYADATTD